MPPRASRREVMVGLLHTAATVGTLRMAFAQDAFAASVKPLTEVWAKQVSELARDYRQDSLSATQWQDATETLNRTVPLHELMSYIDFERIAGGLSAQGPGEHNRAIWLPDLQWKTHRIWTAIFILRPGDAVPPHGHNGFVGAHLVLKGRLHARSFDRIADAPGRMHLRPRIDAAFGPGETVSMSEERGNVHWFISGDEPVFTFDINVAASVKRDYVNPVEREGRIYLAPEAKPGRDGLVEAAVIPESVSRTRFNDADAFRRFG